MRRGRRESRRLTAEARIALLLGGGVLVSGLVLTVFLNLALRASLWNNPPVQSLAPRGVLVSIFEVPGSGQPVSLSPSELGAGLSQQYILPQDFDRYLAADVSKTLLGYSLVAVAALALVAFAGSLAFVRRAVHPLAVVADTARELSAAAPDSGILRRIELPAGSGAAGGFAEIRELVSSFNTLLDRLQASLDDTEHFTSRASHELRTSLTVVRTHLEVGLTEGGDPKASSKAAVTALSRVADLMEDMVSLSIPKEKHPDLVDLAILAAEVVDDYARPGRTLDLDIPPEGVPEVWGDAVWLRRAIANLVDNAFKYGPAAGPVTVSVANLYDAVIVRVTDSGPGISLEAQERIWQRFARGEGRDGDKRRGFGLGLALVQRAVEAAGGVAWVDSVPGRGSAFLFSIPVATATAVDDASTGERPQADRHGLS